MSCAASTVRGPSRKVLTSPTRPTARATDGDAHQHAADGRQVERELDELRAPRAGGGGEEGQRVGEREVAERLDDRRQDQAERVVVEELARWRSAGCRGRSTAPGRGDALEPVEEAGARRVLQRDLAADLAAEHEQAAERGGDGGARALLRLPVELLLRVLRGLGHGHDSSRDARGRRSGRPARSGTPRRAERAAAPGRDRCARPRARRAPRRTGGGRAAGETRPITVSTRRRLASCPGVRWATARDCRLAPPC